MAGKSKKLKIKKLQINLTNRWLYTLIVFFSLIVIGVFVYAQIPNPGHDITRIEQPSGCGANQFLKWTGSSWTCEAVSSGIVQPSGCDADQFLQWTGSSWTCEDVCLSDGANCPPVEEGLWNSFSSGIYYDNGDVNIYDNTHPSLNFGDAFGNSLKAGVTLQLTDEFLDIGDYMAEATEIGIRFWTDDAERMRIDKDGNVGIGTTTPGAKLDVAGDLHVDGIFSLGTPTTLTPNAADEITITRSFHKLDTYGEQPTDSLDTINGGEIGMILVLQTYRAARDVTVRKRTGPNEGNIYIEGTSFTLSSAADKIVLIKSGTNTWTELSRSNNV
jgi:hypothetical protein